MANASRKTCLSLMRLLSLLAALLPALVPPAAGAGELVKRRILAVYDSRFEAAPDETLIHRRAEMPLNHLGYILDYADAAKDLPDPDRAAGYAAVLTWFTYEVSRPAEYMAWTRRLAGRGVPFIILGHVGVQATPRNLAAINRLLAPMGIALTGNFVEATAGTRIIASDAAAIDFEHPLGNVLPPFPVIRRLSREAGVLLEVEAPAIERGVRSALVTAGENGAFVVPNLALYVDPALGRTQWIVNPFVLFTRVLGAGFPVPDTTTVSGRRLFYSLMDGDGWNDDVSIDRHARPPAIAAEVAAKELIEPYPDLPVTVAVIASDLDPAYGDGERAAAAARHIFALPQVEVASHTATSPQVWSFYEHYDRAEEERLMAAGTARPAPDWLMAVGSAVGIVRPPSEIERNRALYLSGSRGLPRAYLRDPFSLDSEVNGAAEAMRRLAPEGKPVALYSWSGDARPFAAAVRASRLAGLRNIGGGGARIDPDHPSIGDVTPIARTVGGARQIYAVDATDSRFTGHGGLAGFSALKATLEGTESPVRLKGVGLHYHAFAAKSAGTLAAVRALLDWARTAELIPITAAEYAAIADGFFTTRIEQEGPDSWRVSQRDGLETVRFDAAADLGVDIGRSRGVVGFRHHQGALYVALDAAVPEALIVLAPRGEGAAARRRRDVRLARLADASWMVREVTRAPCRLTYSARGFAPPRFTWKDVGKGRYRIEARRHGLTLWQREIAVAADGALAIAPIDLAPGPVEFVVTCARPSPETAS